MKTEAVFKLPDEEKMLKRLFEIDLVSPLQKGFFPLLTRHAGEEVTPAKIIELLAKAIEEYTRTFSDSIALSIKQLMYLNAGWFAKALVDDEVIAKEIKQHFITTAIAMRSVSENKQG